MRCYFIRAGRVAGFEILPPGLSDDEAGQAFQQEAGHRFRFEAGRDSDLMSASVPI